MQADSLADINGQFIQSRSLRDHGKVEALGHKLAFALGYADLDCSLHRRLRLQYASRQPVDKWNLALLESGRRRLTDLTAQSLSYAARSTTPSTSRDESSNRALGRAHSRQPRVADAGPLASQDRFSPPERMLQARTNGLGDAAARWRCAFSRRSGGISMLCRRKHPASRY